MKLSDIAIIASGQGAPQDENAFSTDEGLPFIRAGSLEMLCSGGNEKQCELINEDNASKYRLKLMPSETILFAKSGMSAKLDRVYKLKQPAFIVSHLAAVIPNQSKVDPDYLQYWFGVNSPSKLIKDDAYPSIRLSDIENVEIELPTLKEQKRIAAILDQANALRRQRQQALNRLNQLSQAIFYEMFGALLRTSEKELLGDVCDVRDGTHDSPKYVENGFPLLTSKNFSSGDLNFDGARFIAEEDYHSINKRSKVSKGDIVMPMIGTIGSPVIIKHEPQFAIKNVALIKFAKGRILAPFLKEVLNGELFKKHVANKGRGGTQKFIALGDIRSFEIPVPNLAHQEDFQQRLESINNIRDLYKQHADHSMACFSSLQHRAFRGEL